MSVTYSRSVDWIPQNMFHGSPQTTIITEEGLSMNMSTMLLKTFSPFLSSLLSLPPCVTTCIIIPDFSICTVSNLLQIINSGFSSQCKDVLESTNIERLARVLGFNIKTLEFGKKGHDGPSSEFNNIKETKSVVKQIEDNHKHKGGSNDNKEGMNVEESIVERIGNGISVSKVNNDVKDVTGSPPIPVANSKVRPKPKVDGNISNVPKLKVVPVSKPLKANPRIPPHKMKHQVRKTLKPKMIFRKKVTDAIRNIQVVAINGAKKTDAKSDVANVKDPIRDVIKEKVGDVSINKVNNEHGIIRNSKVVIKDLSIDKYIRNAKVKQALKYPNKSKSISKLPNKDKSKVKLLNAVKAEVKILSECQLCEKSLQSEGHVLQHLVHAHFRKEVKERFSHLYKNKKCLLCNKETKKTPLIHIGATHRKVNEILIEKGLKPVHARSLLKETTVKQEIKEELVTTNDELGEDNPQDRVISDKQGKVKVETGSDQKSKKLPRLDELIAKYSL